jgi:alpha-glucosidase
MDYTPCTFSAKTRKTTYAHELALPFVFESGWIAMADSPEEYLKSAARPILKKLEAAWDETKLLAGYPGEFVVMARRKNNEWFIAAINAGTERKVDVDLKSLGIHSAVIELYIDGKTQNELSAEKMSVTNGKITLPLKLNGGFVFVVSRPLPSSP